MKIENPFHRGEVEVQEMLGERSTAILNGRLYEDSVIGPAHKFLSQLPFMVLSTDSAVGEVLISVAVGGAGFVSVTEDGKSMRLDLGRVAGIVTDPVLGPLKPGARLGGLAIDLATRRRLRINGKVREVTDANLLVDVTESYPNCPKYIQKRTVDSDAAAGSKEDRIHSEGTVLFPEQMDLITAADTFFVGSSNPDGNLDASHRGGNPGFVKLVGNHTLRIPDYAGNSLYNTFGNIHINKNSGLVFWDFVNGRFLHLAGESRLDFSGQDPDNETGGTGRWWEFKIERWLLRSVPYSLGLSRPEYSPFNPSGKAK